MLTADISNSERVTAIWITTSLRRLRPVGIEDFLRRNLRHDHPRHFRIQSANAIAANDKISRIKNVSLYKFQYRTIDFRPVELH